MYVKFLIQHVVGRATQVARATQIAKPTEVAGAAIGDAGFFWPPDRMRHQILSAGKESRH